MDVARLTLVAMAFLHNQATCCVHDPRKRIESPPRPALCPLRLLVPSGPWSASPHPYLLGLRGGRILVFRNSTRNRTVRAGTKAKDLSLPDVGARRLPICRILLSSLPTLHVLCRLVVLLGFVSVSSLEREQRGSRRGNGCPNGDMYGVGFCRARSLRRRYDLLHRARNTKRIAARLLRPRQAFPLKHGCCFARAMDE